MKKYLPAKDEVNDRVRSFFHERVERLLREFEREWDVPEVRWLSYSLSFKDDTFARTGYVYPESAEVKCDE